jgi:hypothetical protein
MKIHFRVGLVKELLQEVPEASLTEKTKWSNENDRVTVEIEDIDKAFLDKLTEVLSSRRLTSNYDKQTLATIQNWELLNTEFTGDFVTRIEQVVQAIKTFFADSPNKWVFMQRKEDNMLVPMYISQAVYHPDEWEIKGKRRRLIFEARVTLYCSYMHRGQKLSQTFHIHRHHINRESGTTMTAILRALGIVKETRQAFLKYEKEVARYQEISVQTGRQFNAKGFAKVYGASEDRWQRYSKYDSMIRDGRMAKIVMDDASAEGGTKYESPSGSITSDSLVFWLKDGKYREEISSEAQLDERYETDESEALVTTTTLPTWPYLKVFDLAKHQFCEMHVSDIEDYPWDKSAFDKLILPDDHKKLIEILVNGTNNLMEDIVAGKTGGIIVLATGKPGVGKTLTAEVYSEFIERPVYSVQCSQLGLNVDSIEKNLTTILSRAQRWNALLLLDEADVYIRHRGHDLHHNAIVGVFLRILEYYRGVLFMTSNLATVIDDAILSRATAHIRYLMPDEGMKRRLWKVLGAQYKIVFDDEDIDALVAEFTDVAGRDIKSMLKLATLMTPGEKPSLDLLKIVYTFQDTAESMSKARG